MQGLGVSSAPLKLDAFEGGGYGQGFVDCWLSRVIPSFSWPGFEVTLYLQEFNQFSVFLGGGDVGFYSTPLF